MYEPSPRLLHCTAALASRRLALLGAHSESTSSLARHSCLRQGVHGEEAQAVDDEPTEVAERVRQQLAGAFRGGVRGDRCVHRIVFGEGHRVVVAVDRGGRAVDERVNVDPSQMGLVRTSISCPGPRMEPTAIECALLVH